MVAKEEISRFSFCHNVFKKSPTAEASESIYMRERVLKGSTNVNLIKCSILCKYVFVFQPIILKQ